MKTCISIKICISIHRSLLCLQVYRCPAGREQHGMVLKTCELKMAHAKARIWPRLSYVRRIPEALLDVHLPL